MLYFADAVPYSVPRVAAHCVAPAQLRPKYNILLIRFSTDVFDASVWTL